MSVEAARVVAEVLWARFERGDFSRSLAFVKLCRTCKTTYKVWSDAKVISVDLFHPQHAKKLEVVTRITEVSVKAMARQLLLTTGVDGVDTARDLMRYIRANGMDGETPEWYSAAFLRMAGDQGKHHFDHGPHCLEAMRYGGALVALHTRDNLDATLDLLSRTFHGYNLLLAINHAGLSASISVRQYETLFTGEALLDALVQAGLLNVDAITIRDITRMFHDRKYVADALVKSKWNKRMTIEELAKATGKTYLYGAMRERHFVRDRTIEFWQARVAEGKSLLETLTKVGLLENITSVDVAVGMFKGGEVRFKALERLGMLTPERGRAWYVKMFPDKEWRSAAIKAAGL